MLNQFVSHLECALSGERFEPNQINTVSSVGKPLLVRYRLDEIKRAWQSGEWKCRTSDMWRYRELLPLALEIAPVSLGEICTPLIRLDQISEQIQTNIWFKDEGRLPTGSFKARGLVMAVNLAKVLGVTRMAIPTNGNAGAAMAAYCVRAGIQAHCFCPSDTPKANLDEIVLQGAQLTVVDGMIDDCGKLVAQGEKEGRWFNCATLREPYRIEGKKTMGLELAEQFQWTLPDAIFYPTGGGTGLIGMWKAFDELESLGLIGSKRPKMFAIQSEGCAPIVRAYDEGAEFAQRWQNSATLAHGIRVPQATGDFLILRAVRESRGAALAVSEAAITQAWRDAGTQDGMLLCPEGAATLAGVRLARSQGLLQANQSAVLFNCASGYKYPLPSIDQH